MLWSAILWLAALAPGADVLRHGRRTPRLSAPATAPGHEAVAAALPALSVVIAARNEADHIAPAVLSLVAQDYPDLQVIAVDDRSTDATPRLLDTLAAQYPDRLRVVRIDDLPRGWLGKPHALGVGAEIARGAWLLFTDADVVFASGALRRAVAYAESTHVDHRWSAMPRCLPFSSGPAWLSGEPDRLLGRSSSPRYSPTLRPSLPFDASARWVCAVRISDTRWFYPTQHCSSATRRCAPRS